MRAPDATRSANFAAGMGFALVTAVGWGLNWPVPKYLLTELPLLSTLKQGTIDAFALSSPTSDVAVRDLGAAYLIDIRRRRHPFFDDFLYIAVATTDRIIHERGKELAAYYRGLKKSLCRPLGWKQIASFPLLATYPWLNLFPGAPSRCRGGRTWYLVRSE
jgi:hypothetical protein